MSTPVSLQEDQLLELLLHLKKTTPDQARTVLAGQPQISYALIALMVKINAVDVDVLQKTVASFSAPSGPVLPPTSALPPHLAAQPQSQYRTSTPQSQPQYTALHTNHIPTINSYGNPVPPPVSQNFPYSNHVPDPNPYAYPMSGSGGGVDGITETLASIPDDQKAMIMRVISMTPDQIALLPPQERASILQLRATLGLSG